MCKGKSADLISVIFQNSDFSHSCDTISVLCDPATVLWMGSSDLVSVSTKCGIKSCDLTSVLTKKWVNDLISVDPMSGSHSKLPFLNLKLLYECTSMRPFKFLYP